MGTSVRKRKVYLQLEPLEQRCNPAPTLLSNVTLPGANAPWVNQNIAASPIFADLDGDGQQEVIVPGGDKQLYAYKFNRQTGQVAIDHVYSLGSLSAQIQATPVVADLPSGKAVFAGASNGYVFGWDARSGAILSGWPVQLDFGNHPGPGLLDDVWAALAVGDLDRSGIPTIVVASLNNEVTAIRANGQVMWRFSNDDTIFGGIVIADLNRDGYPEVITVGDSSPSAAYWAGGRINVLSWDGRREWVKKTDQVIWSSPVVADLKGDGTLDVIVGTGYNYPAGANTQPPFIGNRVYALDAQGNDLPGWPYSTGTADRDGRVFASPAVADLEGNGSLDVVVVDASGMLHAIRSNGSPLWTVQALNAHSQLYTSPIIAYSNGQSQIGQLPDVIAADDTGNIKSFRGVQDPQTGNWTASQQWALRDALPHYNAPAVGHFRGDGSWQLAILAAGIAGGQPRSPSTLLLYDLDPTSLTPPWPELRRDSSSNAVARPIGFANGLVTTLWHGALGRDPSPGELTTLASQWQHAGSLRPIIQGVIGSTEARTRQINAWYQTYLKRAPEDAGRAAWLNALASGLPYANALSAIASSPEAFAVAGGTNPAWVRQLYTTILGRTPTDAEVSAWVNALNSLTRSQVASLFLHSVEYTNGVVGQWYQTYGLGNVPADSLAALGWDLRRGKNEEQLLTDVLTSNGDYVATQQEGSYLRATYQDMLQRAIAPSEAAVWLKLLENGTVSLANIAALIVHSAEYHGLLVTSWYQKYLNRTPSPAERDAFAAALATQPRDAVQKIFLQSDEYWALAGSNPTGFIRKLYLDNLGRPANDAEVNDRLAQYAGRDIRAFMPLDTLHATEYYGHAVDAFYYLLLRRLTRTPSDRGRVFTDPNNPDGQGWVNAWAANGNPEDILASILASGEYQGIALSKAFWNGQRWLDVRF